MLGSRQSDAASGLDAGWLSTAHKRPVCVWWLIKMRNIFPNIMILFLSKWKIVLQCFMCVCHSDTVHASKTNFSYRSLSDMPNSLSIYWMGINMYNSLVCTLSVFKSVCFLCLFEMCLHHDVYYVHHTSCKTRQMDGVGCVCVCATSLVLNGWRGVLRSR